MTYEQFVKYLRSLCAREGGTSMWALKHGLTRRYVNDVVMKRRGAGKKICVAAGVTKITIYKVRT